MREIIGLKHNYIKVCISRGVFSYGGDQAFFDVPEDKKGAFKRQSGCGMIALMDVYSYLKGNRSFVSVKEYRNALNKLVHHIMWHPSRSGTKNLFIVYAMNRFFRELKIKGIGYWAASVSRLEKRITRMLGKDIPVIICIPFMLLPWQKKHRLALYTFNEGRQIMMSTHSTNAHFVTVTGIVEHNAHRYYRVSSWGKCLYIDTFEYEEFLRKHLFGFWLGNIMNVYVR